MNNDTAGGPTEPIAIVGIGCRFPGGARGPQEFWEQLAAGTDAVRELPADRWDNQRFYDPDNGKIGKMSTRRGGFLDGIDLFDPAFFGISPREAVWLDPQQRLLLMTALEALEDGGQVPSRLAGLEVGVFMGGFTLDYQLLQNYGVYSRYELQAHSATGMMMTMLANRLSYAFDFRGPSLAVDTACSGSLVAVHLAARSIWSGECEMALAGGANVIIAPNMTIAESKGGFLSPDGRCKAFSAAANGYVRGEGAGVVVLKPLSAARRDNDPIHALIRGTAVGQDGQTNGITVPSGDAQRSAMRAAYARAGVDPRQVHYIEAHGTGTPVGDPIEARAIGEVAGVGRPDGEQLWIGSVKTNIGHLEAAAGVAGLIKATLTLEHGAVPGHLHLDDPNPEIPFSELNLRVPRELTDLPAASGPRFAGVNSFGFGGTNAHVVIEEAPAAARTHATGPDGATYLLPFSAHSAEALAAMAEATADVLETTDTSVADVGRTRSLRRDHLDYRLTVVGETGAEIAGALRSFASGDAPSGVPTGRVRGGTQPKVAFVCSGMGPQWLAMARKLLTEEPVFRRAVERCDEEFAKLSPLSLLDALLAPEADSRMAETEVAQPTNFAVQVGLSELWRSWGIEPDAVVGHSTGEVAAQYLAGVLSLTDAVTVVYHRSTLQQRATGSGRMLAVGMTPETLSQAVADAGPLVSVAAVNSATAVTLSGEAATLEGMAAQLDTFGVFHRFLAVKVPYHSHLMDPLREDLLAGLADISPRTATVPLYSTVTGTRIDGRAADAHYWWRNVRATVLFASAFRELVADGHTVFVEVGPHPVLGPSMKEMLAELGVSGVVLPTLRREADDMTTMLGSLGGLYTAGCDVRWEAFHPDDRPVPLPAYPWQLKSYWNESIEARQDRYRDDGHALLGPRIGASRPTWERELSPHVLPFLADHRVQGATVVPGAALIEMALAAGREVYGERACTLENLELRRALVLAPTADPRVRTTIDPNNALVEIASYVAGSNGERTWTVHATARLSPRRPAARSTDPVTVGRATNGVLGHDEHYARAVEMGFGYGPAFQGVRSVVKPGPGGTRVVAAVRVPAAIRDDLDRYLFHPGLLDTMFQVLLTAAAPDGSADGPAGPTYLPVDIGTVSVLGAPADEMTVVAEVLAADADHLVSDITLHAADGRVLVEVGGFRARSISTAAQLSPEQIDRGLHELVWREAPPADDTDPDVIDLGDRTGPWLILAGADGAGDEVGRLVRAAGARAAVVRPRRGAQPAATGPDDYVIDPDAAEHYREVLRLIGPEVGTVVHLWGPEATRDGGGPDDPCWDPEAAQTTGARSVLYLTQALAAEATQQLPRLWIVTECAQAIVGHDRAVNVTQAPLWGIGRVVGHQELAGLWGGLVDLDGSPGDANALLRTVVDPGGEDQIAFRDGRRFVARLVTAAPQVPFPTAMRPHGSYLVTGGVGALGLVCARYLVARGARSLVLVGRSPLPPREVWRTLPADHPRRAVASELAGLLDAGVDIEYVAVDVADETALRTWAQTRARAGHPPIAGIIHTAGVVEDELIQRMSGDAFDRVMRPKLGGAAALHRVFRDADLDHFVLFGSTGSVITSVGQANYAAANAFLDSLAQHRRRCGLPAQTLGWGPWSVGMVADNDLERMYVARGIRLITPDVAARVLDRTMHHNAAHLVVIFADWAAARAAVPSGQLPPVFAELDPAAAAGDDAGQAGAEVLDQLRRVPVPERADAVAAHLRNIVSGVLGLGPDDLGLDQSLTNLGLDSMMAVELKARISAAVRVDVSVLDLLQGISTTDLAAKLLPSIDVGDGQGAPPPAADGPDPDAVIDIGTDIDAELEAMLAHIPPDDLERLLREIEQS
ncbi:MAG: type I polyketide synthase [Pseudonocardia sp.]